MVPAKKETNAQELFQLLESLSSFIEEKVQMYALGGTALTILDLKSSTLDIDINIDSAKQYEYICKIFERIGFKRQGTIRWITQEGLAFDLFSGSYILGTDLLRDCLELAKFIRSVGKIELYTLSLYDIIISKLARGDERDFNDIRRIFEREDIDLRFLVERYLKTMEVSIVGQYKQKLLDLIWFKFEQWNFPVDKNLITEVQQWPDL